MFFICIDHSNPRGSKWLVVYSARSVFRASTMMICVLNWRPSRSLAVPLAPFSFQKPAWFGTRGMAACDWVFGDSPAGPFEVYILAVKNKSPTLTAIEELHENTRDGEYSTSSFAALQFSHYPRGQSTRRVLILDISIGPEGEDGQWLRYVTNLGKQSDRYPSLQSATPPVLIQKEARVARVQCRYGGNNMDPLHLSLSAFSRMQVVGTNHIAWSPLCNLYSVWLRLLPCLATVVIICRFARLMLPCVPPPFRALCFVFLLSKSSHLTVCCCVSCTSDTVLDQQDLVDYLHSPPTTAPSEVLSSSLAVACHGIHPHHKQRKPSAFPPAPYPTEIDLSPPFLQPAFQLYLLTAKSSSNHFPCRSLSRILGCSLAKTNRLQNTPPSAASPLLPSHHHHKTTFRQLRCNDKQNLLNMPYNTRRKSLSLPSLGIQLPNTSRAHRPSISKAATAADSSTQPPAKKVKRSHTSGDASPTTSSRPRSSTSSSTIKSVSFAAERPKSSGRTAYEHTPPPSPGAIDSTKIDINGINDDIVIGVIEQLEKTGSRPHLIKELSTVLSTTNDAVLRSVPLLREHTFS